MSVHRTESLCTTKQMWWRCTMSLHLLLQGRPPLDQYTTQLMWMKSEQASFKRPVHCDWGILLQTLPTTLIIHHTISTPLHLPVLSMCLCILLVTVMFSFNTFYCVQPSRVNIGTSRAWIDSACILQSIKMQNVLKAFFPFFFLTRHAAASH